MQWLNSAGTDWNGVPPPVSGIPPPEIAVPPPTVAVPPPGNDVPSPFGGKSLKLLPPEVRFLADRTNGRAYATVLCLSVRPSVRLSVCDVMYCG